MNVNFQSQSPSFGTHISERLEKQLYKQLNQYGKRTISRENFSKQIKNVKEWGSDDLELTITQNSIGNYALGIKKKIPYLPPISWAIEHLSGKTELAQFLRLKKSHILNTENTINYIYKKYGLAGFKPHNKH